MGESMRILLVDLICELLDTHVCEGWLIGQLGTREG